MPRMLYCGLHKTFGGNSSASVRVQVPEVRKEDGKDRERCGTAPEKVSSLRWKNGTSAVGAGHSIQRIGLVCDGLRGKIERQRRHERGRVIGFGASFGQEGFASEGFFYKGKYF